MRRKENRCVDVRSSDGEFEPIVLDRLRRSCAQCSLQQLCLPAGIGAEALARMDELVRDRRVVDRGERLFRAGDALSSIYVARTGAFKTIAVTPGGDAELIGFHLPGELIGLDALGGGSHRCEAVALDASEVCEVPYRRLTAIAAQIPALQAQLLRVIGGSVDRDQDHLGVLMRRQASERIALFLHGIGERYVRIGQSGQAFRLPMSREDNAHYLGLALETVSRGFTRLQEDGVITVHGRRIEIVDRDALERLAHGGEEVSLHKSTRHRDT